VLQARQRGGPDTAKYSEQRNEIVSELYLPLGTTGDVDQLLREFFDSVYGA
jgi:hypothetical protein